MQGCPEGRKVLDHPLVGRLTVQHTTFPLVDTPDLKLILYTPAPGTETVERIQQLMAERSEPAGSIN